MDNWWILAASNLPGFVIYPCLTKDDQLNWDSWSSKNKITMTVVKESSKSTSPKIVWFYYCGQDSTEYTLFLMKWQPNIVLLECFKHYKFNSETKIVSYIRS